VQNLFPRAARLYLMRLDDLWASLFSANSPPAPGLTASSCSYGRGFASRFFQLRLAATPCGSATVAVIGPDWLLSSNKILPMLGTRCRRLSAGDSGCEDSRTMRKSRLKGGCGQDCPPHKTGKTSAALR
jgi:hypothetical protein